MCMPPPVSHEHLRTGRWSKPSLKALSNSCMACRALAHGSTESPLSVETCSGTFHVFDALPHGAVPLPKHDVAAGVAGQQQRARPAEGQGADGLLAPPSRISQLHHVRRPARRQRAVIKLLGPFTGMS